MIKRHRSATSPANFYDSHAFCRICFDDALAGPLVSPCRCVGSSKQVHLHCLQVWVLTKYSKLEEAHCEVCESQYSLEWKLKTECFCIEVLKTEPWKVLVFLLLCFLEYLAVMLGLFLQQKIENSNSKDATRFFIAVFLVSVMLIVLLPIVALRLFRQTCFGKRIRILAIHDYHEENDSPVLATDEVNEASEKLHRYPSAIFHFEEDPPSPRRSVSEHPSLYEV